MTRKKSPSAHVTRKRRARINHILDVALSLIAEDGLEGFSLHKLAARLDLTVGALYRYFDSKTVLIGTLETRVIQAIGDGLRQGIAQYDKWCTGHDSTAGCLARLMVVGDLYRSMSVEHPQRMVLIGHILADPNPILEPAVAQGVMRELVKTLDVVRDALNLAEQAGALEPGNATQRSILFWTSTQSVLQVEKLAKHDPTRFNPQRLFHSMLDTILHGWGAPRDVLEQGSNIKNDFMETCR